MPRLTLESAKWADLETRNGGPSSWVAERLKYLVGNPSDLKSFQDLWPYLCSEDTPWTAAFAATPYVVDMAARLSAVDRFEHVYFVGYVEMCRGNDERLLVRGLPEIRDSYFRALADALPLALESLAKCKPTDVRHALAAIAAIRGTPKLAAVINNLDSCPHCGEDLLEL